MPKKQSSMTEKVGKRLKALRLARGYEKLRAFALDIGVNEDRYDKWEKGKAMIPPEYVEILIDRFGITADWLYFGDAKNLPKSLYDELAAA